MYFCHPRSGPILGLWVHIMLVKLGSTVLDIQGESKNPEHPNIYPGPVEGRGTLSSRFCKERNSLSIDDLHLRLGLPPMSEDEILNDLQALFQGQMNKYYFLGG